MEIKEYREGYAIREFVLRKEGRQIILGWNYQEGTHFLVCLYDREFRFSLPKINDLLEEKGISEEKIVKSMPDNPVYRAENGEVWMYCLSRRQFQTAHRNYTITVPDMRSFEISLFACQYNAEAKELSVYQPLGQENIQAIPLEVRYQIKYQKGFLGSKRRCVLQLPVIPGYQDGALTYHVSGMAGNIDIPLPRTCLGKSLYITMPNKDAELIVHVQQAYRKHYRLA